MLTLSDLFWTGQRWEIRTAEGFVGLDVLLERFAIAPCADANSMEERTNDAVNHPAHYNTGDIECIDAIQAATTGLSGFEGYCIGCAIKYLWRWKHKGGVEDLKKAEWYIAKLTGECEHSGAQKTAKIIGNIHDGKDGQHDEL